MERKIPQRDILVEQPVVLVKPTESTPETHPQNPQQRSEALASGNGDRRIREATLFQRIQPSDKVSGVKRVEEDPVRTYLNKAARTPLLTREEEVELAQTMEFADEKRRRARKEESRKKWDEEYWRAKKKLIEANLRLVVSWARKYQGKGMPFIDLIQEGNIGLMRSTEMFDWRRGNKFSTYAVHWIRQTITRALSNNVDIIRLPVHKIDELRRLDQTKNYLFVRLRREPTTKELADEFNINEEAVRNLEVANEKRNIISLDEPIRGTDAFLYDAIEDPVDEVEEVDDRIMIHDALEHLDPISRRIIEYRFGLDNSRPRTLDEIAALLQIKEGEIKRLGEEALLKLRIQIGDSKWNAL